MNVSSKHHYIPRFLIRQFADEEGMLYIYDKSKGQIQRDKKGAGAIFFEMNRNTIKIEGQSNDNMEKLYGAIDDKFAKGLNTLLKTKTLTEEVAVDVVMLASTLKWRIPATDGDFDNLSDELGYAELPIKINLSGTNHEAEKSAMEELIHSETFKQTKRVIFPFLPFYTNGYLDNQKLFNIFKRSYIINDNRINSILGDVPILEKNPGDVHNFSDQIFPISNQITFIYSTTGNQKIKDMTFYVQRDIAILEQSKQYVVSRDKAYLQSIINAHAVAKNMGMVGKITGQLFEQV